MKLDTNNVVQSTDIPNKLIKKFGCLFSSFIACNVNKYINLANMWMLLRKPKTDHFNLIKYFQGINAVFVKQRFL